MRWAHVESVLCFFTFCPVVKCLRSLLFLLFSSSIWHIWGRQTTIKSLGHVPTMHFLCPFPTLPNLSLMLQALWEEYWWLLLISCLWVSCFIIIMRPKTVAEMSLPSKTVLRRQKRMLSNDGRVQRRQNRSGGEVETEAMPSSCGSPVHHQTACCSSSYTYIKC